MHILVTNDDGPPSPTSSPYVHSLVRELQRAGHTVSVCLPHAQRSWIGKAHMIGQTVKPLYYRPSATFDPTPAAADKVQGTTHSRPARHPASPGPGGGEEEEEEEIEEWILVDGTPASAAQIGLHHLFRDRGPVDLVVSGPNYGRNTTAVFALSSGTLGGALEAAVCRKRAVAVSYAYPSRHHDPAIIAGAARHAARVVGALHAQWPADGSVDLYTVNVPLVEGVEGRKTLFAGVLQNYWGKVGEEGSAGSSCFQEVEAETGDEEEEEERIREEEEQQQQQQQQQQQGAGGFGNRAEKKNDGAAATNKKKGLTHRHFKWAPRFTDVYRSVQESPPGNDGWCVQEGYTSITPLKANFWHSAPDLHGTELRLEKQESSSQEKNGGVLKMPPPPPPSESTLAFRPKAHFSALIAYEDAYVQPLILSALQKLFPPEAYTLLSPPPPPPQKENEATESTTEISLSKLLPNHDSGGDDDRTRNVLQITPYEAIDWDFVAAHPGSCLVNSYMLRKALIRKHYLSSTVEQWVSKRPDSVLRRHVKRSEAFEMDYAEFLDDALVEAFDLRASLEKNGRSVQEGRTDDVEWWILKPSMSDRGQGIRLFSTMDELQAIFDEWEEGQPGSDEDEEDEGDGDGDGDDEETDAAEHRGEAAGDRDYITTSHLRHFVAQPYIHPPLLLPGAGNRKFHIRTYVACVGSLDVYVYRHMLALFAGRPYQPPRSASAANSADGLEAHLTNTCLQRSAAEGTVRRFRDLEGLGLGGAERQADAVFAQICGVVGELFEAAARGMLMHFRPLPNAFEVFGVDFLVDAAGAAWLLEVNAFPDFRQTGDDLRDVVAGLWEGVLRKAVAPFFFGEDRAVLSSEKGGEGEGEGEDMVHVRHVDLLGNR